MPSRTKATTFAIVVSRYNLEFTQGLLSNAEQVLKGFPVHVVWVPGAFEVPLQVKLLAQTKKYSAVLAFGLVWQGKTAHAQEITRAVTDALMRISLDTEVPIIHEVLSVSSEREARDRCLKKKLNRGREGAEAALALLGHPISKVSEEEKVLEGEKEKEEKPASPPKKKQVPAKVTKPELTS